MDPSNCPVEALKIGEKGFTSSRGVNRKPLRQL